MKKIITLILFCFFTASTKGEIKSIVIFEKNEKSEIIKIEEGQIATCIFWRSTSSREYSTIIIKYSDNKTIAFNQNSWKTGDGFPVIVGPASIRMGNYVSQMATFKIENNFNINANQKNITVLPKETENMELILESSDDMVKWEKDVIGDKPKANRKKFYRLRAVKK